MNLPKPPRSAKILGTLLLFSAVAITVAGIKAQDKKPAHINVPVSAALSADVASPEAIVKADYECISGGVGVVRQWSRDFSLYDPNAHFFAIDKNPKTGAFHAWTPSLQEFTDATDAMFGREGFTEHELAHKIVRYGNTVTVFSSYEGKLTSTGKIEGSGVNIYQLYSDGQRWWISSVS